ncbi:hypothetical protein Poly51_60570 [Rubripirellula tenax]|uniref:DUF1499 domain-containing protein n=1 Tax=Rubripirellula tenax TaxID=2528015 RepID=A0A5C6E7Y5_9BACT|nr:DUF1499 domain-containing protein [Rubripirellula tenax]TWU44625.1 hypothetical protein Poly51_60570 [Rubripirellula tenax]
MNVQSIVRGLTTNHAQLSDKAEDRILRPVQLAETPTSVADKIVQWTEHESGWALVSREPDDNGAVIALHLTRTTRIFRFVDDIRVQIVADPGGRSCRVDAESQSRVGKGDLGQNARNLRALVTAIR